MVNLSELLSLKEKKVLRNLTWLVLALMVLIISGLFLWSMKLNSLNGQTAALEKELEKASAEVNELRNELERWMNTQKELEELGTSAFYSGNLAGEDFRDDLRRLFQKAGLAVPAMNYQYEEILPKKKKLKRLTASFNLRTSYPALKSLLYQIETWPKWLTLDQINFQRIEEATGVLELRLSISGYMIERVSDRK